MRYFFHVAGVLNELDEVGHDFATLSDARIHAVRCASDHLRDRPELVWLGEEFRVEVTDQNRQTLFTFIAVGVDAPAEEGRIRL